MFIKKVLGFVNFLSLNDHPLDIVLSHLVHRVLDDLSATSIVVFSLNRRNQADVEGEFGLPEDMWEKYPSMISVFDNYPITDALRNRKTVWINTLPDWGDEYPLLQPYHGKERSFVCMSMEKSGTPVASVGIFMLPTIELDAEIDAFLSTIVNLLSLYLYRNIDTPEHLRSSSKKSSINMSNVQNQKLSERQMLILRMIADSRTNVLISELLGYSESTIRQETIKIYAKLGCNGREEAARIYREKLAKEDSLR